VRQHADRLATPAHPRGFVALVYHGAPMPPSALNPDSRLTLAFLAALVALGPLSVDMYLPAMPAMQAAFDTDIVSMHLTLSAYLWGFALFHLFCGPLADRYGRKPVLIAGTGLFVAASAGCALAGSIEELTLFRFIQGIGACVGPTLARTITRDVFGPRGAARALSLIAMLMALAPAVAPGLGGIMLRYVEWPSVFVFLGLYGLAVLWIVLVYLPETLRSPQSLLPANIAANYLLLIRDPVFLPVACASALVYSGLMAYLASSGFVFITMLGVPVEFFGLIFLSSVFGYMGGSAVSARLAAKRPPATVLLGGGLLAAASTVIMLVWHLWLPTSILALIVPMSFYAAALGLVLPQAMAMAMEHFPHIAATNSSLFGFLQMGLSAVITAAVGGVLVTSPLPMILTMAAIQLLAVALIIWGRAKQSTLPGSADT
jgi:DHA1 family bicyclomycin/chloramphenicol resistance-like MFS transporter